MLPRRLLEIHLFAQAVARCGDGLNHRLAIVRQKIGHAIHFSPILFRADNLLAGAQAHVHFAVNATRMLRTRRQVFLAAADLKQVQQLRFELFGRRSRVERSILNRRCPAQPRGHLGARERIR